MARCRGRLLFLSLSGERGHNITSPGVGFVAWQSLTGYFPTEFNERGRAAAPSPFSFALYALPLFSAPFVFTAIHSHPRPFEASQAFYQRSHYVASLVPSAGWGLAFIFFGGYWRVKNFLVDTVEHFSGHLMRGIENFYFFIYLLQCTGLSPFNSENRNNIRITDATLQFSKIQYTEKKTTEKVPYHSRCV